MRYLLFLGFVILWPAFGSAQTVMVGQASCESSLLQARHYAHTKFDELMSREATLLDLRKQLLEIAGKTPDDPMSFDAVMATLKAKLAAPEGEGKQ